MDIQQNVEDITALHIVASGNRSSGISKPFRSNHFSVIIVTQGILKIKVNLFDYVLEKDDIIIISPAFIRQLSIDGEVEYYMLLFTPKILSSTGLYQKHFRLFPFFSNESRSYLSLQPEEAIFLTKLIDLLKDRITSKIHLKRDEQIIELLFQSFLIQLISNFEAVAKENNSINKNDLIYRFLIMLPNHFKENREVNYYADKLFVNPKYLTQVLTKKTGRSARDYITQIVLMEAKVLLDNPGNSIKDIAEELNFSDQFHFTHFFKKYIGMTPTEYRKKI